MKNLCYDSWSNHFFFLKLYFIEWFFDFFWLYMIRILVFILLFPFRFLFYLYYKLNYLFSGDKVVHIKIPEEFAYFEKIGIIKFISEKEEINYFLFLILMNKIAEESKIKKVILEIPSLEGLDWNQIEDIISVIERIRKSGKLVYSYVEEGGIKTLMVASSCDYRYTGDWTQFTTVLPHFEQFYLGDFFKSLGVKFDVFTAGKYKSAGEMYEKNKISAPAKENILELIQDKRNEIYQQFLKTSGLKKSDIQKLWNLFLNQSIVTAQELFELGFIHQLMDQVQLVEFITEEQSPFISSQIEHNVQGQGDTILKTSEIKEKPKSKLKRITFEEYVKMILKKEYKLFPFVNQPVPIALVVMDGIIIKGKEEDQAKSGTVNAKGYIKILQEVMDSAEKAVLLYINSPGGMSDASELLYQQIRKLSRKKPVFILQGNVAASGGYYISCAGNKVYAYHSTITGSIGVLRLRPVFHQLYKKFKINKSKLMFDKTTDIFSESTPLSKESRELLQKTTMDAYKIFLDRVARGRGKLTEQVKHFAEGRVYSAFRFKEAGLIDDLTNFVGLLEQIKKELQLKENQKLMINFYPVVKFDLKSLLNIKKLLTDNRSNLLEGISKWLYTFTLDWYISIEALSIYLEKRFK
jgi:protease-4